MAAPWLHANETDQFLLASAPPMADVGRGISRAHYEVLESVTREINASILTAQRMEPGPRRTERLEYLQGPRIVADRIRAAFGPGFFETIGVEWALRSEAADKVIGEGRVGAYKDSNWIYAFAHLPIDPRSIPMMLPSSTIRVYGHYIGTDKLGHFHDLGHYYYLMYLGKRNAGKSEEDAMGEVVMLFSRGPLAETTLIGFLATGICSNADLVANYMGLKFYRNMTEPVTLKGEVVPPLLVRVGGFWELNTHVRPDTDFMEPFISDHWNEALNPNVYEWGLRWTVGRRLRAKSDQVLKFYCDVDQRPRNPEYFADLAVKLSTYYGEDYGYFGDPASVMSIATTCFPKNEATGESATAQATVPVTEVQDKEVALQTEERTAQQSASTQ